MFYCLNKYVDVVMQMTSKQTFELMPYSMDLTAILPLKKAVHKLYGNGHYKITLACLNMSKLTIKKKLLIMYVRNNLVFKKKNIVL